MVAALPELREELAIFPGPNLGDGQPSWTLHDPVRNQFFRIDWLGFEILSRWTLGGAAILDAIRRETTLQPDPADMETFLKFLATNQLLRPAPGSARLLAERQAATRGDWKHWLLHHYLFFRVPLVRPDAWLDRWAGVVAPLFSRTFAWLTLVALIMGLAEVYRDWERFAATLVDTFTPGGLLSYGLTLVGVKLVHELGHAFTAKRYGCRVPTMGVAFLVMMPVAYTDTNEAWKLANRRQRLAVAAAGIATELVVAIWATVAWTLLPEGLPKGGAFMLATTTWISTLAVNTSPFMRFDGYFLLSDWLDMPNLHSRAFTLARWHLRERLFGLGHEPPEYFAPRRRTGLILFAYVTWIYRLVVFLGIAVLVYTFFIKAVGIFLFLVEIGWFLALPVWGEVRQWPGLLREQGSPQTPFAWLGRPQVRRSLLLAIVCAALIVVPWPARQSASALLKPAEVFPIHAPAGAQVVKLPWREGATVAEGQTIVELTSSELRLHWNRAQARLERQRWQASNADVDAEQRQNQKVLQQEEVTAESELASVRTDMELYAPRAPFNGILMDLNPDLKPGVWVGSRERLGVLVKPEDWQVEAWVDEDAVRRIAVGNRARFFTDGMDGPVLALKVTAIDADATRSLPNNQLASRYGGSIVTREKQGQMVPERAMYRVTLQGDGDLGSLRLRTWRGHVVIDGKWEAPVVAFLRSALVVVWRELGF